MTAMAETLAALAVDEGERAIIDIGSNTVRLVIYGGPRRAPTMLFNEKVTARLGKGVAENGALAEKGMALALAALARFATILRLRGVHDVQTVATAASRDASNGAQFLERVRALGLTPRLLTGEEEALTSAQGVLAAFPGAQGIVGDLGGGSLELVDIAQGRCRHGTSLPLGTLRLPALREGGSGRLDRRVTAMLHAADWGAQAGQTFYLVGGSWRALARYAAVRRGWPVDDTHAYEMSPEEAITLARGLASHKPAPAKSAVRKDGARKDGDNKDTGRKAVGAQVAGGTDPQDLGISASRLASLPDAAALLAVLVRELRPARLVFSSWGLREGLLAGDFSPAVAGQDPVLVSVGDFAETRAPGTARLAAAMARWAAPVAEGLAGQRPQVSQTPAPLPISSLPQPREATRLAATMLALASLRVEPNLRARQAAEWALHKRWIGLDTPGRAMIALALLASVGRPAITPDLLRLATPAHLREAQGWGLAIRLARRFSGLAEAPLVASQLALAEGRLELRVPPALSGLVSEAVLKDLRALAEALGVTGAVVALG